MKNLEILLVQAGGIKIKIKFPVVAGEDSEGNANGNFYPTGEKKITEDGDEWGSKGQGGQDQEVEIEVLGCDDKKRPLDADTGMSPFEVGTSKTTLDSTPGAKSDVEVEAEVWFVCCVCGTGGKPTDKTCEECCTEENFTEEGGGDRCHLGAWRTGGDGNPGNRKVRTPQYSTPFQIGPPGKENQELAKEMHDLIRSDVISDLSSSYQNTSCG